MDQHGHIGGGLRRRRPRSVNVAEAKARLSELVQRAASGEEIIISRNGEPQARLVALAPKPDRRPGKGTGKWFLTDDFDDPRFGPRCWLASKGRNKLRMTRSPSAAVTDGGFRELPVTFAHAEAVRTLPRHHTDPFDRLIIATAVVENCAIVTTDGAFQRYDVSLIDART